MDSEMVRETLTRDKFVLTVEEGTILGGFGSAFLESAVAQNLDTRAVRTIALPDKFIEHGNRNELLHQNGLSAEQIADACREFAACSSN